MSVFPPRARATFADNYPEVPHKLEHDLHSHPLLELEALARLGESLPAASIECNHGAQPIGVEGVPEQIRDGVGDTIRHVARAGRWVCLRNVEQRPDYARLLADLLAELAPQVEARTGRMINLQSFIFVTSPGGVTPYHFDPEHNILLQLRGSKAITVFPAGRAGFAADEQHEALHLGGRPELPWREEMAIGGAEFVLAPGEAVYVPVTAPHFVRNGPEPSISISITWRSEWSYAESDARCFNAMLRRAGLAPRPPGRWPRTNLAKAYGWRVVRRLGASGWPRARARGAVRPD